MGPRTEGASAPTLRDVARRAGVSNASASRALNGGTASPDTLRLVEDAARHLGYRPNPLARGLRSGRTGHVALLVPDIANPVYALMTQVVQAELARHDLRLVVHQTAPADLPGELLDLRTTQIDAAIAVSLRADPGVVTAVRGATVPVVVIGQLCEDPAAAGSESGDAPGPDGIDSVRADSRAGMALLVAHLYATGARRIALVNGPVDTTPGRLRAAGFRAAMRAHGLRVDLVRSGPDFSHDAAAASAASLLDATVPDAIIGANDVLALAVLRECATRGLRVPQDLLLAGMDNTDLAAHAVPSLTSVDLAAEDRAQAAARALLQRLDGGGSLGHQVFPPRLLVRESTEGAATVAATGDTDTAVAPAQHIPTSVEVPGSRAGRRPASSTRRSS